MPTIWEIDYDARVPDILPVNKRDNVTIAEFRALMYGIAWSRTQMFAGFKFGTYVSDYTPGTYNRDDKVKLQNGTVYYSKIDSNTDSPEVSASWGVYQSNFVGVDFREQFNGQKLLLEAALSTWFNTVYEHPTSNEASPDYYLPKSEIYLITNEVLNAVFIVGETEIESSSAGFDTSSEFIGEDFDFSNNYSLTVKVPVAFWTALSANVDDRDQIIRNFVDKYVIAGVFYNIVTY